MTSSFNEQFRHGSASWAEGFDLGRAGLMGDTGLFLGYMNGRQIRINSDAPIITFGGAGSGKTRDLLGYVICTSPGKPMLVLDPRGELEEVSRFQHTRHGEYAYRWRPTAMLGASGHRCNVLDVLEKDSVTLHSDSKFTAESLITFSGGGNSRYFEQSARRYSEAILKADVELKGYTSLPSFYRIINTIEGDPPTWATTLERMLASRFGDVRQIASEMLTKQTESPKEFGSILAELYNNIGFLSDPALLASLEDKRDCPDDSAVYFSLSELCQGDPVRKIFLNVAAENLSLWSPVLRLFFTTAMLWKSRSPQASRILLLVDEAAQLGRNFEALIRGYVYGRGAGIQTWSIWQDIGQIQRNFSQAAIQTFMGSSQVRQFVGIRDVETARLASSMIGNETLHFDDKLAQGRARKSRMDAMQKVIMGHDSFSLGHELAHYKMAEQHRSTQARALITPEEILSMPEDKQLLFISGMNLRPIYGDKFPYFIRREMAGQYLPNPYHPPQNAVRVQGMFGAKYIPVITEPVPENFSLYPQNSDGTWSYCASQ